jgi:hypothetical protein
MSVVPTACRRNDYEHDSKSHDETSIPYRKRDQFIDVMLQAIALNGAFFNTRRMVLQYVLKAYV